jgi:hypothetical protein
MLDPDGCSISAWFFLLTVAHSLNYSAAIAVNPWSSLTFDFGCVSPSPAFDNFSHANFTRKRMIFPLGFQRLLVPSGTVLVS